MLPCTFGGRHLWLSRFLALPLWLEWSCILKAWWNRAKEHDTSLRMMVSWQQSIQAGKLPLNNAHCDFGILWLHLGIWYFWHSTSFNHAIWLCLTNLAISWNLSSASAFCLAGLGTVFCFEVHKTKCDLDESANIQMRADEERSLESWDMKEDWIPSYRLINTCKYLLYPIIYNIIIYHTSTQCEPLWYQYDIRPFMLLHRMIIYGIIWTQERMKRVAKFEANACKRRQTNWTRRKWSLRKKWSACIVPCHHSNIFRLADYRSCTWLLLDMLEYPWTDATNIH